MPHPVPDAPISPLRQRLIDDMTLGALERSRRWLTFHAQRVPATFGDRSATPIAG